MTSRAVTYQAASIIPNRMLNNQPMILMPARVPQSHVHMSCRHVSVLITNILNSKNYWYHSGIPTCSCVLFTPHMIAEKPTLPTANGDLTSIITYLLNLIGCCFQSLFVDHALDSSFFTVLVTPLYPPICNWSMAHQNDQHHIAWLWDPQSNKVYCKEWLWVGFNRVYCYEWSEKYIIEHVRVKLEGGLACCLVAAIILDLPSGTLW